MADRNEHTPQNDAPDHGESTGVPAEGGNTPAQEPGSPEPGQPQH